MGAGPWGGLSCGWGSGDLGSPELKRELNLSIKLLTVWWFWRCDLSKVCNCQKFDAQIELWLGFWGSWVSRIVARAQFEHEVADSIMLLAMRPFKSVQLSEIRCSNWAVALVLGTLDCQNWSESSIWESNYWQYDGFGDATFQQCATVRNLMFKLSCGIGFGDPGLPEL